MTCLVVGRAVSVLSPKPGAEHGPGSVGPLTLCNHFVPGFLVYIKASQGTSLVVKNAPANAGDRGPSQVRENSTGHRAT